MGIKSLTQHFGGLSEGQCPKIPFIDANDEHQSSAQRVWAGCLCGVSRESPARSLRSPVSILPAQGAVEGTRGTGRALASSRSPHKWEELARGCAAGSRGWGSLSGSSSCCFPWGMARPLPAAPTSRPPQARAEFARASSWPREPGWQGAAGGPLTSSSWSGCSAAAEGGGLAPPGLALVPIRWPGRAACTPVSQQEHMLLPDPGSRFTITG